MQDYGAMIRSTFELGSVRDAELLFETIVKNAFPRLGGQLPPRHHGQNPGQAGVSGLYDA